VGFVARADNRTAPGGELAILALLLLSDAPAKAMDFNESRTVSSSAQLPPETFRNNSNVHYAYHSSSHSFTNNLARWHRAVCGLQHEQPLAAGQDVEEHDIHRNYPDTSTVTNLLAQYPAVKVTRPVLARRGG